MRLKPRQKHPKEMDYFMENHELVLVLNEVTVLMSFSAVGIISLLGMFAHLSISSIFGKDVKK